MYTRSLSFILAPSMSAKSHSCRLPFGPIEREREPVGNVERPISRWPRPCLGR